MFWQECLIIVSLFWAFDQTTPHCRTGHSWRWLRKNRERTEEEPRNERNFTLEHYPPLTNAQLNSPCSPLSTLFNVCVQHVRLFQSSITVFSYVTCPVVWLAHNLLVRSLSLPRGFLDAKENTVDRDILKRPHPQSHTVYSLLRYYTQYGL